MCGIAGRIGAAVAPPAARETLARLRHRGPDACGEWSGSLGYEPVWLGHTRLAILDLSARGAQPMASRDGRWIVAYNGEIYNHRELRAELAGPFRGQSDTETLVEALAEWGVDRTLPRLNGMFAIAALDTVKQRLWLFRDPFGIKPLYWCSTEDGAAFASESRVLAGLGGPPPEVDATALQTLLALRYVPSPQTLARGIRRLEPGHAARFGPGDREPRVERFAAPPPAGTFRGSFGEAAAAYAAACRRAVERQLLSDVPVGVLLSGGIDSALVAALVRERGRDVPAFTVGFGAGHRECELEAAALTARALGLVHRPVVVTPQQLWDALDGIAAAVEEPLGTTSILPMWELVRHAKREVTVVLTGQGSDEPWGGYRRHRLEVLRRLLPGARFGGRLLRAVDHRRPLSEALGRAARSFAESDLAARFEEAYALFSPAEREALTGRRDAGRARESIAGWLAWAGAGREPSAAMLAIDARMNLADDLLLYGDKISMAFSLEARVPMLDLELVRLVESLPRRWRVGVLGGKRLHRHVARSLVPREVMRRRKKGFLVPFGAWIRGPWRERAREALLGPASRLGDLLDRGALEVIWRRHQRGERAYGKQLFALLQLARWLERAAAEREAAAVTRAQASR